MLVFFVEDVGNKKKLLQRVVSFLFPTSSTKTQAFWRLICASSTNLQLFRCVCQNLPWGVRFSHHQKTCFVLSLTVRVAHQFLEARGSLEGVATSLGGMCATPCRCHMSATHQDGEHPRPKKGIGQGTPRVQIVPIVRSPPPYPRIQC